MSIRDRLNNLVSNAMRDIAPLQAGVVVAFEHNTNLATVRCVHRSGRGFTFFELPWTLAGSGTFTADPTPEYVESNIPGTHVVLGFRNSDWSYPILLSAYDPLYMSGTREKIKRNVSSYTTKTDRSLLSDL